ncbi:hypothetical protein BofuT4_P149940.1 [Botrytis cinerea T4]|uniref:Uncharacterized protein n=1 Tax=Botryotinia fuckeliana (strain T4) TaxID=999810 RepID=G2YW64_BOTF4|nr:hypothetical protein BofuT4_P149940.1 [Botrytis cinerea T4]
MSLTSSIRTWCISYPFFRRILFPPLEVSWFPFGFASWQNLFGYFGLIDV